MSGDDGSTSIQLGGGCRLAVHGGQLNAGGQLGSSGVRLLPRLPDSGGDGSCGNGGDPLSAGHFRSPTGLTGHASSPVGPAGPIGAGDVRSHHGLCGGAGFTSPPGLITGSPLDPRGVRSSPGLIGAAGNGVAGNAPIFMSRSGATGSFPFTSPIFNPNVSSPFAVPGNAAQWIAQDPVSPFHINGHHSPHMTQFLMHPPNLEGPGSSFIASQVTQTKSIPGNFAIGSLQSLLHHVSSSAAGVGRVRATSICDGSDQLLSAQSSLDGSHVQTCGYSAWNDGMHQVTASSPIDQEVDDVPGQDSSDSDTEDPLQDEHIDADAEDSDGSSEDAVPINNQSTLQGSANGSSEDAVPIDNQSTPQGPADEDALLQYEIVSIPPGDDGRVSNKLGYKKRVRVPKGVTIPNERPPRAIGTIEKAMRNAKNRNGKPIFEPVLGMVFDSTAEAYKFYNLYSWERGFGIRFGTNSTNPGNKKRTKQLIVCEKEGFDPRCKSSSKRSHCKAML